MKKIFLMFFLLQNMLFLYAQYDDPYQFFPANVGDRWEYTLAGGSEGYTIIKDSIDTNDSSKFIFFTYPPPFYGANYRIDKNYNIFYLPQFDNWHIYKLDAQVDEFWIVRAVENNAAKVLDISESYIFGKLTLVKTIGFYSLTRGDTVITENSILHYWEKLAYGFGLISREDGATQPYLLRGCRIDGVTYGTVDVEEPPTIPSEFVLYQNYPNPFNPTTTIEYALSRSAEVTLRIYNIIGEEVMKLAEGYQQAGRHKLIFDARGLPSGVYIYTLAIDEKLASGKMILGK